MIQFRHLIPSNYGTATSLATLIGYRTIFSQIQVHWILLFLIMVRVHILSISSVVAIPPPKVGTLPIHRDRAGKGFITQSVKHFPSGCGISHTVALDNSLRKPKHISPVILRPFCGRRIPFVPKKYRLETMGAIAMSYECVEASCNALPSMHGRA